MTRQTTTDQTDQTDQTYQTDQTDRLREGWCKNCQTCKIANLQFRSVSESDIRSSVQEMLAHLKMQMTDFIFPQKCSRTMMSAWLDWQPWSSIAYYFDLFGFPGNVFVFGWKVGLIFGDRSLLLIKGSLFLISLGTEDVLVFWWWWRGRWPFSLSTLVPRLSTDMYITHAPCHFFTLISSMIDNLR